MKVNGYQLREKTREVELRLKVLLHQFEASRTKFKGETKEKPQDIDKLIAKADTQLAKLGEAQTRYNLAVTVTAESQKMTLLQAIRTISAAGRREKLWRKFAAPETNRYSSRDEERDPDKEYAQEQVSPAESLKMAASAAGTAGAYRQAIAKGNAQEIDLEIDPALFE